MPNYFYPQYTVSVISVPKISVSNLAANDTSVTRGVDDDITLSWKLGNILATSECRLFDNGSAFKSYGALSSSMSETLALGSLTAGTHNFQVACSHNGVGEAQSSVVNVSVYEPPVIDSFTANQSTPYYYKSSPVLSWQANFIADGGCRILSGGTELFSNLPEAGMQNLENLTTSADYTLECGNPADVLAEKTVSVTMLPPPSVAFSRIPSAEVGESVEISN